MIYRRFTAIILLIIFAFFILPNPHALAANDDFEVEYEFFPETMGYKGGNVQLVLDIENTGTTNITWIDVVINTAATFSQRWTGTILAGSSRTISFTVPFREEDLNVRKILQVSMNNNITTNPDGIKMFNFELEGLSYFVDHDITVSPEKAVYEVGDTVQITHEFSHRITTHAAIGATTRIFIRVNGEVHSMSGIVSQGNIFPGASVTHITNITFDESYAGEVNITSNIQFEMMEKDYGFSESYTTLTVASPEPDINFSATLSAAPMEIEAGDLVAFDIDLENTGSDTIDYFEIRNSEGGLVITTGSFAPGDSRTAGILSAIHETSDISYVVIAYGDGYSVARETNRVHITVTEPEPEPAATETPTQSPTPEPSPEDTPEMTPSAEDSPTVSASTADETAAPSTSPALTEPPEESTDEKEDMSFGLFVFIALTALIVIALIVVTIIFIIRSKSKKIKDSDFE